MQFREMVKPRKGDTAFHRKVFGEKPFGNQAVTEPLCDNSPSIAARRRQHNWRYDQALGQGEPVNIVFNKELYYDFYYASRLPVD